MLDNRGDPITNTLLNRKQVTNFGKEHLCALLVFLCALVSRAHAHSLEGTLPTGYITHRGREDRDREFRREGLKVGLQLIQQLVDIELKMLNFFVDLVAYLP